MHDHHRGKELLRAVLQVAERFMEKGNLPLGCVLADPEGTIIEEGENTVVTSGDNIAHCEINLIHRARG